MVDIAEIMIKIKGDASDLDRAATQAKSSVSGLSSELKGLGSGAMLVGAGLTAAITVPLTAMGAFALKAYSDVGGGLRELQRNVIDTGTSLASLKQSWQNVWGTVPVDAKALGDVMGTIHTQTGLAGSSLEDFTTKAVNLSRVTGTDLVPTINSAIMAMKEFNVPAQSMSAQLDDLYKVSLATNTPFDELTSNLQNGAPIFSAYGLNTDAAAAFLGELNQAGIDAGPVMTALRIEISKGSTEYKKDTAELDKATLALSQNTNAKKEGALTTAVASAQTKVNADLNANLGTTLQGLITQIRTAKTTQEGLNIAVQAFGSRGGAAMYAAIMSNKVGFDDFAKVTGGVTTNINQMATSTTTLSDAMTLFRQKTELAFAPLGNTIGTALTNALGSMNPLLGGLQNLGKAFDLLPTPVKNTIVLFGAMAAAIGPTVMSVGGFASAMGQLAGVLSGPVTVAFEFLGSGGVIATVVTALTTFGPIIVMVGAALLVVVGILATFAAAILLAYHYSETFRSTLSLVLGVLGDFTSHLGAAAAALMSGNWSEAGNQIKIAFTDAYNSLKTINWTQIGIQIIKDVISGIQSDFAALKGIWDTIRQSFYDWLATVNWTSEGKKLADALIAGFKGAMNLPEALTAAFANKPISIPVIATTAAEVTSATTTAQGKPVVTHPGTPAVLASVTAVSATPASTAGLKTTLEDVGRAAARGFIDEIKGYVGSGEFTSDLTHGVESGFEMAKPAIAAMIGTAFSPGGMAGLGAGLLTALSGINVSQIGENLVSGILSTITGSGPRFATAIGALFNPAGMAGMFAGLLAPLQGAIGSGLTVMIHAVTDAATVLAGAVAGGFNTFIRAATDASSVVMGAVGGGFNTFIRAATDAVSVVSGAVGGGFNTFIRAATDAAAVVEGAVAGGFSTFVRAATDAASVISTAINQGWSAVVHMGADLSGIYSALSNGFSASVNVVAHLLGAGGIVGWAESKLPGWGLALGPKPAAATPVNWATVGGAEFQSLQTPAALGMQHGGILNGPHLVIAGEAGPEAWIPYKYWSGIAPWVFDALPKLQEGGLAGSYSVFQTPSYSTFQMPHTSSFAGRLDALTTLKVDEDSLARALTKALTNVLQKQRSGNTYNINGIKMDEVIDELKKVDRIDELLYGDYI